MRLTNFFVRSLASNQFIIDIATPEIPFKSTKDTKKNTTVRIPRRKYKAGSLSQEG